MGETDEDEMTLAQEMRAVADGWDDPHKGLTIYGKTSADIARKWADELDERYVALPTDDEGRPWHVGDRCVNGLGHCMVIGAMGLGAGEWETASTYTPDGRYDGCVDLNALRRPSKCAAMILDWVRRARSDEHMDLGELESIAGRIEAGEEW